MCPRLTSSSHLGLTPTPWWRSRVHQTYIWHDCQTERCIFRCDGKSCISPNPNIICVFLLQPKPNLKRKKSSWQEFRSCKTLFHLSVSSSSPLMCTAFALSLKHASSNQSWAVQRSCTHLQCGRSSSSQQFLRRCRRRCQAFGRREAPSSVSVVFI